MECMVLEVVPSETNLILVGLPTGSKSAVDAHRYLEINRVIVRRLASRAYNNDIRSIAGSRQDITTRADILKDFMSHAKEY